MYRKKPFLHEFLLSNPTRLALLTGNEELIGSIGLNAYLVMREQSVRQAPVR